MRVILFLLYYLKLRLSVLFETHRTVNPLDLKWRWKYWNNRYKKESKDL